MATRKKKEDSAKEPIGKDSNRPESHHRLDALTLHTEKHCYFKRIKLKQFERAPHVLSVRLVAEDNASSSLNFIRMGGIGMNNKDQHTEVSYERMVNKNKSTQNK